MKIREAGLLLLASAACCALAAALVARDLKRPGPYYDEVVQAVPAVEFLRPDGRPPKMPGSAVVWRFGGWLPVMTQPYMGALKSQLLIPIFSGVGASTESLRLTTLCWGLSGVLLTVLWTRRALGLPAAAVAGALLASDPSLLFASRHDWGSFSLGFLLRAAALVLLTRGWALHSTTPLLAGGLCLGLGFYNKIDFAVIAVAAALALLAANPRLVREALTRRRGALLATLGGFAVGAAPMLAALGGAIATTGHATRAGMGLHSPDWGEKLRTVATVFDGSYFQRLVLAGGRFSHLGAVEGAAATLTLVAFLAAAGVLAATLFRDMRRGVRNRTDAFLLAAALLGLVGFFLTPRATRIHHALNVYPFPHLVIAAAAAAVWRRAGRGARLWRVGVALALAATVAAAVRADLATLETIRATGGKGRWSDAIAAFGAELRAHPEWTVVSMDWGFDGPLQFVVPELDGLEPFWQLRGREKRRTPLARGSPHHVYLVFEPRFALFRYGDALLSMLAQLPAGSVSVRRHIDRQGDVAFHSIRFSRPHQLVYDDGRFEVRWL